jgi:DNA-binding transcriptional regulator YdaS (Cro superfamily)
MTKEQFDILVSWAGSKSQLARLVGVSRAAVSQWIRRGYIPAPNAVVIERYSLGKFKAVDMSEKPDA